MNEQKSGASGVGPCFLLFLVFMVLKLCDVIDWSWWYVTLPLTIPLGLAVLLLLFIGVLAAIAAWNTK